MKFVAALSLILLAGCAQLPHVSVPGLGKAVAPANASAPAEVKRTKVDVPAGSTVSPEGTIMISQDTKAEVVAATSGTLDPEVAKHQIDSDAQSFLAKNRMLIGAGLILLGVVFGFVVPEVFRWPLGATIGLSGTGLFLVLLPQPPTWLLVSCVVAGAALAASHYLHPKSGS